MERNEIPYIAFEAEMAKKSTAGVTADILMAVITTMTATVIAEDATEWADLCREMRLKWLANCVR